MLITGEKLLLTGTLAPRNDRILYGFWTPTPETWQSSHILHM